MTTVLTNKMTSIGKTVNEISVNKPVLLIFLRHFGCTFCREALAEIADKKSSIESEGVEIVFVHMSDDETAERYFKRHNLEGAIHISDPDCEFYREFGLVKGTFQQLLGFNVWIRGVEAGIKNGHGLGVGRYLGDAFQMPGVFVIRNGTVREKYIHKQASDRPDYEKLAACCVV